MKALRKAVRRIAAMIFPWPAKHERQAAIASARRQREAAEAQAGHATKLERDIRRMAAENHFADGITRHIMRGYQ